MGLVCLLSLIPFLSFGLWLIAAPILLTLVMRIIVLVGVNTMRGLFILRASLIAAPLFILVAPFISSFSGWAEQSLPWAHRQRQRV
jgi:hypothetical protein